MCVRAEARTHMYDGGLGIVNYSQSAHEAKKQAGLFVGADADGC
jgi:hypothetical protein